MYLVQKRVDGSEAERWKLGNLPFVVGRGDQAHAKIADSEISRQHFEICMKDDGCVLKDLNSRNGTYVNGNRVPEAKLKSNDQIRAGETNFIVTTDDKPVQTQPTMIGIHSPKKLGAK